MKYKKCIKATIKTWDCNENVICLSMEKAIEFFNNHGFNQLDYILKEETKYDGFRTSVNNKRYEYIEISSVNLYE